MWYFGILPAQRPSKFVVDTELIFLIPKTNQTANHTDFWEKLYFFEYDSHTFHKTLTDIFCYCKNS